MLGHDTGDCIVTQVQGSRAGAHSRRCDTAPRRPAIQPALLTTWPARAQERAATCARPGHMECRDTKFCIMAEGQPLCHDTGCDTVQER